MPHSHCRPATTRAARGATGHSGRENGQDPPSTLRTSKAPRPKTLGPTLPLASALTSARSSARRAAGRAGMLASWGQTLTLGRPSRGLFKGPGAATPGIGDPRVPAPDSPCCPTATWATKGAASHSGQKNGQGPLSPRLPSKAPWAKTLGLMLPLSSAFHSAPPPRPPHGRWMLPARVLGANPNPRWAPEGPLPRVLAPQLQALGTPDPQGKTNTAAPPPPGPLGALPLIQGWRKGRAL